MKLLFDHNISPRLVDRLKDAYPDANHVSFLDMDQASDEFIWKYAKRNGYIIVTKDSYFNDLTVLHGFPPKIIWLQIGNCKTFEIEALLRINYTNINEFIADLETGILLLG
jgi:predicted nuclease of predicted toxin-antitoxin system